MRILCVRFTTRHAPPVEQTEPTERSNMTVQGSINRKALQAAQETHYDGQVQVSSG